MMTTEDLGKYLRVPAINGRITKSQYQYAMARIDKCLASGKTTCLYLVGRATLIQSTIEAIPSYIMQTTRLPRSICDDIDRKIRQFLWGGSKNERKAYLVNCDSVTKPKELGDLSDVPMGGTLDQEKDKLSNQESKPLNQGTKATISMFK